MNRKIRLIIIINTILVLIFIIFFNRYYLGKIEKRNTIYKELSVSDVFYIIKKYDFFCKEYEWTKNLANPEGKGIKHKYKEIKIYEDEIIIDEATGLIWQKSGSNNCKSFKEAEEWVHYYLNKNKFAGFNKWRLPTIEESMGLMEPEPKNNNLHINTVFDNKQAWIWTSDIVKEEKSIWVVNFYSGNCYGKSLNDECFVRAVCNRK